MLTPYFLKQNDTYGSIDYKLTDSNGSAFNIPTDATVSFYLADAKDNSQLLINGNAATVTDPLNGEVSYNLSDGDLISYGTFQGEFRVTFSNGEIKSFPNNGFLKVVISQSINNGEDQLLIKVTAIQDFEDSINATVAAQKARVDNLLKNTPQASEVLDAHTNSDGSVIYDNLKARLDTEHDNITSQLADVMQNVIYASDYGVKADGITDDTAAFQNAINASSSLNKPLFVKGTRIKITSPIMINDGMTLNIRGVSSGRGGLVSIWLDMSSGSNGVLFQGVPASGQTRSNNSGEISGIRFETYAGTSGASIHTFMKDIAYRSSVIKNCQIDSFKYIFSNVSIGSVTDIYENTFSQIGAAVFTNNSNLGDCRFRGNYFNGNATYKPTAGSNVVRYPDFIDSTTTMQVVSMVQINNNWFEFFTYCIGQINQGEITGNLFDYCYCVLQANTDTVFSGNIINHGEQQTIVNNIQSWAGNTAASIYTTGKNALIQLGTNGNIVNSNFINCNLTDANNTYFVRLLGGSSGQTGFVQYTSIIGNNFLSYNRDMLIDFSAIDFMNTNSYFNTNQLIGCDFRDLDQVPLTSFPNVGDKTFIPGSKFSVNNQPLMGVKYDVSRLFGGACPYHIADSSGNLQGFKTLNLVPNFNTTGWSFPGDTHTIATNGLSVSFTPTTTGWKNSTYKVNNVQPNTYYRISGASTENISNNILLEIWLYDSTGTQITTWHIPNNAECIGLTPSNISYFMVYLRLNLTTVANYTIGAVSINQFSSSQTRSIIQGTNYRFGQYFDGTNMNYEAYI